MRRRREFHWWILGLMLTAWPGWGAPSDAGNDVLRFVDGSTLHGQLKELDFEHGLIWQNSAATAPIDFQAAHVDVVRFAHSGALNLRPTCHVRFANGDDLFGALELLDTDHVELTTWFGDKLSVPRAGVQSVSFLSKNYTILYEGPYDNEGWVTTGLNPNAWHYRDRALETTDRGMVGRNFGLSGSCTLEFDLTWGGYLGLAIAVYTEAPDRLDFNSSSYLLQFSRGLVVLQRLRATAVPHNLGTSPLVPALATPGTAHLALQFNKDESEMELFVNGALVKRWKDEDGFSVTGSCIVLEQTIPTYPARVSNMRVASWEGRHEPEMAISGTNVDMLHFNNRDSAGGKIHDIKDGKVTVDLAAGLLNVPVERLSQIDFASVTNAMAEAPGPSTVRAFFPGGGSLSFQLEKWSDNLVQGHSSIFGRLAFQPSGIRELQFNLDRPRSEASESPVKEFENIDE